MSRARRITVSVRDVDDFYNDESQRQLTLSAEPHYVGRATDGYRLGTGVYATGLWIGDKHVVLRSYSVMDRGDGERVGITYRLCDTHDIDIIERVWS